MFNITAPQRSQILQLMVKKKRIVFTNSCTNSFFPTYIASNRKKLAQTDSRLVQYLIALMDTKSLKVQCQAALALRNLASDGTHIYIFISILIK